jgi:hypothetical protein
MTDFNTILIKDKLGEDDAFASTTLNPTLRWLKFILTDDQPNGNKQRIPQEEFDNLIKSGINMPIKMAEGDIADGHDGAKAIGVITHLKKVANKIEGLAALWSRERPEDVDKIIEEFESDTPPQISWEVPYDEEIIGEDGVATLKGIILRAATLVRLPAFEGRTPVLAVAAKEIKPIEAEAEIKEEITMTDDKLKELEVQLSEANETIAELRNQLKEKEEGFASIENELTDLREFKAQADKDVEEAEKLDSVRAKFAEAEIKKDDEYFADNKERFLGMEDTDVDFMVQEMSAFAKTSVATASISEEEEEDEEGLPAVTNTEGVVDILADPKKAGQQLRESRQKK